MTSIEQLLLGLLNNNAEIQNTRLVYKQQNRIINNKTMSVSLSSVYQQTQSLREIEEKFQQAINNEQRFQNIVDDIVNQASSLTISESYRLLVMMSKNLNNNSSVTKKYAALFLIKKLILTAYHHFYIFSSVRAMVWITNMAKFQAKKSQYERVKQYIKQLSLKANGDQVYQQRQCYKLLKFVQQFLPWFSQNIPTHINAQYVFRSTFARCYQQIPQQFRKNIPITAYQNFSYSQFSRFQQNFNIRKSHNKQLIKQLTQFISLQTCTVITQQKYSSQLLKQVVKTADSYCIKSIISQICALIEDSSKLFCCLKLTEYLMNVGQIQFVELVKLYVVPALLNYILPYSFIEGKILQRVPLSCSLSQQKCIIDCICIWKKITQDIGLSTKFYDQVMKSIEKHKQKQKQKANFLNVQEKHIGQYLTNVIDLQGVNNDKRQYVTNEDVEKQLIRVLNIDGNTTNRNKPIKPLLVSTQPPIQSLPDYNSNDGNLKKLNISAINQLSQFNFSMISGQKNRIESSGSSGGFGQLFAGKPEQVHISSSESQVNYNKLKKSNSRGEIKTPKKGISVQSNKNINIMSNSPQKLLTFKDIPVIMNNNQLIDTNLTDSRNNKNYDFKGNEALKQKKNVQIKNQINLPYSQYTGGYPKDYGNTGINGNYNITSGNNKNVLFTLSKGNNNVKQQSSDFVDFQRSQISKYSQYSNNPLKNDPPNNNNMNQIANKNKLIVSSTQINIPQLRPTSPRLDPLNKDQLNYSVNKSQSLKNITQKSSQIVYFGRSEDFISYNQSRESKAKAQGENIQPRPNQSSVSSITSKTNRPKLGSVQHENSRQKNKQLKNNVNQQSTNTYRFDSSSISSSSLNNSNIKNFGKVGQQFPQTIQKPNFGFKRKQNLLELINDNKNNVGYENILGSQQFIAQKRMNSNQLAYNVYTANQNGMFKQQIQSQIQDLSGGKHNYNQSIKLSEVSQFDLQKQPKNKLTNNRIVLNVNRDNKNLNFDRGDIYVNNNGVKDNYYAIGPRHQYYENVTNNQNANLMKKWQKQQQKVYKSTQKQLKLSKSDNSLLTNEKIFAIDQLNTKAKYNQQQIKQINYNQNVESKKNKLVIVHEVANDSHLLTLEQQLGKAIKQKAEKQQKLKKKQQQYRLVKNRSVPYMNRKMEVLKKEDQIIRLLQNKKNEQDYYNNRNEGAANQSGILIKPINEKNKITDFFLQNQPKGMFIPVFQPFQRIFIKQLLGTRCLLLSNQFIELGYNYSQIKNEISLYLTLFKMYDKIQIEVQENSLILEKPIQMQMLNQVGGQQIKIKRKVQGILQPHNYFNNQPTFQQVINFGSIALYKFPTITIKLLQSVGSGNSNGNRPNKYENTYGLDNIRNGDSSQNSMSGEQIKYRLKIPCSIFNLSTPVEIDRKVIQKLQNKKVLKSEPLPINPEFMKNYRQKISKYFPNNMGLAGGWTLVGYKFSQDLLIKKQQNFHKSKSKSRVKQSQIESSSSKIRKALLNNKSESSSPASGEFRNEQTNQLEEYIKFRIGNGGRSIQFQLFNNPKSLLTQAIVSMLCGQVRNIQ